MNNIKLIISIILCFSGVLLIFYSYSQKNDSTENDLIQTQNFLLPENDDYMNLNDYLITLVNFVKDSSYKAINYDLNSNKEFYLIMAVRPEKCSLCISEINEYVSIIDSSKSLDIKPIIILMGENQDVDKKWFAERIQINAEIIYQYPDSLFTTNSPQYLLIANSHTNKILFTQELIRSQISDKEFKVGNLNITKQVR